MFLPRQFHSLQDEQRTGSGLLESRIESRDEIVHIMLIPDEESRCIGFTVRIADTQYLALPQTPCLALQDQEELPRIAQLTFASLHPTAVETIELLYIQCPLGMQTEGFLELTAFILAKSIDHRIEVAQVIHTIGDPFVGLEPHGTHRIHAETAGQVLLIVIRQAHLIQLLFDLTAYLCRFPFIGSNLRRDPYTTGLGLLRHDDELLPETFAQ